MKSKKKNIVKVPPIIVCLLIIKAMMMFGSGSGSDRDNVHVHYSVQMQYNLQCATSVHVVTIPGATRTVFLNFEAIFLSWRSVM